jgi:hypothetical protein
MSGLQVTMGFPEAGSRWLGSADRDCPLADRERLTPSHAVNEVPQTNRSLEAEIIIDAGSSDPVASLLSL